jgi:hypothetical protein
MVPRRPSGYVGTGHETIGSDILAVPHALRHLLGTEQAGPRSLLETTLPRESLERLQKVESNGWYPIEWLLELTDLLDRKLGRFGLRKVGRTLFKLSHESRVAEEMRCGVDIVRGIDAMYHHANRGDGIGGWRVVSVDATMARLEKTTPHHCALEEGILAQALSAVSCRAVVTQTACFREGANACLFDIVWLGGRVHPPGGD